MAETNRPMRDKDLFEVYRKVLDEIEPPFQLKDILRRVVLHEAKRFYVSERFVYETIRDMLAGNEVEIQSPERRRMINDVYKKVVSQREKYPGKVLKHIVEEVLDEPAPEFYLKVSSAKTILCNLKKRNEYIERQKMEAKIQRMERRKNRRF